MLGLKVIHVYKQEPRDLEFGQNGIGGTGADIG